MRTLNCVFGDLVIDCYKLGTVTVDNQKITSHYVFKSNQGDAPYIWTTIGEEDRYDDNEHSYLCYFGVKLGYLLLWADSGDEYGQELKSFFPHYASWGL